MNVEDIKTLALEFKKLDLNNDGFLTEDELIPFLKSQCDSDLEIAKLFAKTVIKISDKNNDGKLSLEGISLFN